MPDDLRAEAIKELARRELERRAQSKSVAANEPGRMEALGRGALQGATVGFGDELQGAVGKVILDRPVALGAVFQPSPDDTPEIRKIKEEALAKQASAPTSYELVRDGARKANVKAEKAHPGYYFAGEVGGGVASSLAPVGALAKGGAAVKVGLGRALLRAMGSGAAMGAAAGAGNSEAELAGNGPAETNRLLLDSGIGAATGAGSSAIGYGVSKAAPLLLRTVGRKLEKMGINQGRRVLLNGADSLSNKTTSDEAVAEALKSGGILPLGTTGGAAKRLAQKTEHQSQVYGEILDTLENNGVSGPDARELADQLLSRAAEEQVSTGANKAVPQRFFREALNAENVADKRNGRLGLRQAEKIKRELQNEARGEYHRAGGNSSLGNAKMEIASIVRDANEKAIEQAGQAAPLESAVREASESFLPVKQRLSRLIEARNAADKGAAKVANRSSTGLSGKVAMMGAAATGDLGAAAQAAGGTSLLQAILNRAGSTGASGGYFAGRGLQSLGKTVQRIPGRATSGAAIGSAYGNAEIAELIRSLQQSDEELKHQALLEALQDK